MVRGKNSNTLNCGIQRCNLNNKHSYIHTHTHTLVWQTQFDSPEGKDPVAIRMTGMGKGMIWVNGQNIGRYWMSYLSPLGKPSQEE